MLRVSSITSRSNPLLARWKRLASQPDGYRRHGKVWLEGEHLCSAYLDKRPGAGVQAVVTETAWDCEPWRPLAEQAEAVAVLADGLMAGLSTLEKPAPLAFVIDWPGAGTIKPGAPSVVLDRLQDAGNVGTVLRSAAAFGFGQVVALSGTAALWSPKVMRAAMGAHFSLQLVESATEAELNALQLPLLGTSPHSRLALHDADLPWPCAWVMGHEGQGLSPSLAARCDASIRIPQPGGGESLNASVAAAICLYESARRRLAQD